MNNHQNDGTLKITNSMNGMNTICIALAKFRKPAINVTPLINSCIGAWMVLKNWAIMTARPKIAAPAETATKIQEALFSLRAISPALNSERRDFHRMVNAGEGFSMGNS
jgi:hypothetical protein